jgi:hypothetical protein
MRASFIAAVAFFAVAVFYHGSPADANVSCGGWQSSSYGPVQECQAGILSSLLDVTASDTQHASEWCWAASIEAVFTYYGHPVRQQEIVQTAYGRIVNMPGYPSEIVSLLNRRWVDDYGRPFNVQATTYSANTVTAAQDLAANHPLIVGSLGHAMVLTAETYWRDANGNGRLVAATVRDPWPYNARKRYLTYNELSNVNLLVRIRVY